MLLSDIFFLKKEKVEYVQAFVSFGLLLWQCSGQAYLLPVQTQNCFVSWGRNEELITQHDS